MTADLAMDIVRAQVAASLMIVLVLCLRRPVRSLVGPRIAYALWLLPLVGAAAVLAPSPIRYVATPAVAAQEIPAAAPATSIPEPAAVAPAAVASTAPPVDPWQAAGAIWITGILASLIYLLVQQARYVGFARRGAAGPAVVGFWRPKVVLPVDFEERYSAGEQALILEHEVTHLRRQDPRAIGLALLFRCLAWFNPLAYIALDKLRIDQELACDEAVVTRFPTSRRSYAETLAKTQLAIRLPLGCYWPSGTEHPLLERLAMLNKTRISARSRLAGACALSVLCAAAGVAAWAASPAEVRYLPAAALEPEAPLLAPDEAPGEAFEIAAAEPAPLAAEAAPVPFEPQAPAPAKITPPLPDLFNGFADTNLNAPVTVSGVIEVVEWINPVTYVGVRDSATGELRKVGIGTPNGILRLGGSRETLAAGTPISVDGYASSSGAYLQANPAGMTSNGKPLIPAAAANYAEREPELQRLRVCGPSPVRNPNPSPEALAAAPAWTAACDAKMASAGPGKVVEQSSFTNSVIRQGDVRAAPLK